MPYSPVTNVCMEVKWFSFRVKYTSICSLPQLLYGDECKRILKDLYPTAPAHYHKLSKSICTVQWTVPL